MADETDTSEPNDGGDDSKLELPKLGFRRRRKRPERQDDVPVVETPVAESPLEPEPEPNPEPEPAMAEVEPEPEPEPEGDHTQVLPSAPEGRDAPDASNDARTVAPSVPSPAEPKKRKKPFTLPTVPAAVAAVVTGIVVGLGMVGLTFISSRGCQAVRGTGNCGAIGLLFLVAILAVGVLFGAVLLRAWKIGDPLNSSFLAVGLVAVIAMLFFLDYIDQWWMVIAIPAISAVTYLLSWWVTRTFITERVEDEADEPVDADRVGL